MTGVVEIRCDFSVMCVLLFNRIAPAMLRQASYGTIKIGTYQSFKRLLVDRPEGGYNVNGFNATNVNPHCGWRTRGF